jgi:hypothetical protein
MGWASSTRRDSRRSWGGDGSCPRPLGERSRRFRPGAFSCGARGIPSVGSRVCPGEPNPLSPALALGSSIPSMPARPSRCPPPGKTPAPAPPLGSLGICPGSERGRVLVSLGTRLVGSPRGQSPQGPPALWASGGHIRRCPALKRVPFLPHMSAVSSGRPVIPPWCRGWFASWTRDLDRPAPFIYSRAKPRDGTWHRWS